MLQTNVYNHPNRPLPDTLSPLPFFAEEQYRTEREERNLSE